MHSDNEDANSLGPTTAATVTSTLPLLYLKRYLEEICPNPTSAKAIQLKHDAEKEAVKRAQPEREVRAQIEREMQHESQQQPF